MLSTASNFENGIRRLMKAMIVETTKCEHWRNFCRALEGKSVTTKVMMLRESMDPDPFTGKWPCGVCDKRARAIQVLNYLNVLVANDKIWPLPRGFDPRVYAHWNEIIVKSK